MTPLTYIAFDGPLSQQVALGVASRAGVAAISISECKGLNKMEGLLLHDTAADGKKGSMTNQKLIPHGGFGFSVSIYRIIRLDDLVSQISSDYFLNFSRNITQWRHPWGMARKSYRNLPPCPILGCVGVVRPASTTVLQWANTAKEHRSTVFLMLCPDYPTELQHGKRIYSTNGQLGTAIGIVAERSIKFLESFVPFLGKNNLNVQILLGLADYEDTADNLARLKESTSSFAEKVKESAKAVRLRCQPLENDIQVFCIRQHVGRKLWEKESTASRNAIQEAINHLDENARNKLLSQRLALYSKWFPNITREQATVRTIEHGIEYANCGHIFNTTTQNLLVIGTNSIDMSMEYKARAEELPVQYICNVF